MANNDLKRVGLIFKEEGAVDFKKTLQDINIEMNKNYNQFKLTQSQWDNSTKSTEKLKAQQEYLTNAYEIQSDKVNVLKRQLEELESSENKNTTAIKKKQNELTNAEIKLKNYETKLKEVQTQLTNNGKKIEEWGEKVEKSGQKIENAGKKLSAFSAASISALTLSAKSAIDFEDAFTGVEKTVDGTAEEMEELKQGIRDMAKEIPSTTTEISAVAEVAGQLGIKTENILDFSKAMIDLGNSTNLTADKAASQLAKFANITQMSQKDFDKLGSTIVDLGNKYATTEADIVSMAMRLAGAGKQVGFSEAEILGLATALSSVGIEAEMGGSAISKAMVKMQNAVEQGGTKLDTVLKKTGMTLRELELMSANDSKGFKELSQSIGMTSTEVKQLITAGTNLEDFAKVSGMTTEQFKKAWKEDAAGALSEFIKGLGDAESKGESAITMLSEMGLTEVRLRDSLLRAANAGTLFSDAINTGTQAWEDNIALTNEANKRYNTLKSKITIAVNKLKDLAITLGNKLMPSIEKIINKFEKWINAFSELSDEQVDMIVKIGLIVAAVGPLVTILGKVTSVIGGTAKGIGTFTQAIGVASGKITSTSEAVNGLAGVMKSVFSPAGLAIGAVVAGAAILKSATEDARKYTEECEAGLEKTLQEKKTIDELRTSIEDNMQSQLTEIDTNKLLYEELKKITDENGKIKEGYETRAKVITGQLAESLGIEISITDGIIDKYKELQEEIDKLIVKKQAEILLSASEEKYAEAIKNRSQKTQELIDKEEEYNNTIKNRDSVYDTLTEAEEKYYEAMKKGKFAYLSHQEMLSLDLKKIANLQELDKSVSVLKEDTQALTNTVNDYTKDIQDYQYNLQLSTEGTTESLNKMIDSVSRTHKSNGEHIKTTYAEMIAEQQFYNNNAKVLYDEAIANNNDAEAQKTQTTIQESQNRLNLLVEELLGMTSTTAENTPEIVDAWKKLATGSYSVYYDKVSQLPEELSKKIQEMAGVTVERTPELVEETQKMAEQVLNEINQNEDFKQEAIKNLQGYLQGLEDESLRELLKESGIDNVEEVMKGIKEGDLSEEQGENILSGLNKGLSNKTWKESLWSTARGIASTLSGLLTVKASVNGKTSSLPGHKLGLDYVPKDNYVARLHKGERVLTAQENKEYSEAEQKNNRQSSNSSIFNQEIDYSRMANAFLKALNSCKLTLDEDGFAKIVRNELYEVL